MNAKSDLPARIQAALDGQQQIEKAVADLLGLAAQDVQPRTTRSRRWLEWRRRSAARRAGDAR